MDSKFSLPLRFFPLSSNAHHILSLERRDRISCLSNGTITLEKPQKRWVEMLYCALSKVYTRSHYHYHYCLLCHFLLYLKIQPHKLYYSVSVLFGICGLNSWVKIVIYSVLNPNVSYLSNPYSTNTQIPYCTQFYTLTGADYIIGLLIIWE